MLTVLGVDPGLQTTGYALLTGDRGGILARDAGMIHTRRTTLEERLQELYREIKRVLWEAPLDLVALEDLFAHSHFPRTAVQLAHARGVICLASAERGVEVESLPPAEVKKALAGNGRASKVQVQRMVRRTLALSADPSSHVADAMALALTALSRRGVPFTLATRGGRQ